MLVLDMLNPKAAQEREDDRLARETHARFQAEDDWEAALPGGDGYRGPRTSELIEKEARHGR